LQRHGAYICEPITQEKAERLLHSKEMWRTDGGVGELISGGSYNTGSKVSNVQTSLIPPEAGQSSQPIGMLPSLDGSRRTDVVNAKRR